MKGLTAIIIFLIVALLIEYLVVLYAISLGLKDTSQLQWSPRFLGTDWSFTITISPLFHLVPIAVIVSLVFSWTYLTRHVAVKPQELRKGKAEATRRQGKEVEIAVKRFFAKVKHTLLKIKAVSYVWQRIHFARATVKGALMVLFLFAVFTLIFSLLTYPQLIYRTISNLYETNPSLVNFVKSASKALAPIGGVFSGLNNALISAAPGFRDLALSFGAALSPLASLDDAGKYLLFQNIAAWVSALSSLVYGKYGRRSYRYKKSR